MSESIPNSRQESADASTPLPPIDNIHSAAVDPDPELPAPQARPEPALPSDYGPIPTLTPAQTQLDTDMPEAPVSLHSPFVPRFSYRGGVLTALYPFPASSHLTNPQHNPLHHYRTAHRNADSTRQRHRTRDGRAYAVKSGIAWSASSEISKRESYRGAAGWDEEACC